MNSTPESARQSLDSINSNSNSDRSSLTRSLSKKLSISSLVSIKRKLSVKEKSTLSLDNSFNPKKYEYRKYGIIPKQDHPVISMHEYFMLCDKEMELIYPDKNKKNDSNLSNRQLFRRTSILDVRVPEEDKMMKTKQESPKRESKHA